METAVTAPHAAGVSARLRLGELLTTAGRGGAAAPELALAAATEAMALAAELGRAADQARAGELRSLHLGRLGRFEQAISAADQALALLHGPELHEERCLALRTKTLAASETSRFDMALAAASELMDFTRHHGGSTALDAAFALAACFERMGDSWQAERVMSAALLEHGAQASLTSRLSAYTCLTVIGIGMMHRLLDSHDQGPELQALLQRTRTAAEEARALLSLQPNPSHLAAVLGNLGEVMLHQGDLDDAWPLLQEVLMLATQRGHQAHALRVRISLADWHLARQEPEPALALAHGVLEALGSQGTPQSLIRARRSAYRACRALGRLAEALEHLEVAEREERRDVTHKMRTQSALFVSRAEAQQVQWQADQARAEAQQHRERAAEATARAERDSLTGLGNRDHLVRRCAELLPAAQREGRPLALAQIDIDHFKAINDRCGHATGDRVLVLLSQLLHENMRATDVLVRQGGEEFVVVLPDTDLEAATEACERLRERVAAHPWAQLGGPDWAVTISIGLATAAPYELSALLDQADVALYRAKRGGRNRLCL